MSAMIAVGIATVRRPASVFGGPKMVVPFASSIAWSSTVTVWWSGSTLRLRRPEPPSDQGESFFLRGRLGTARALLVWILYLFLFRATRGEDRTGSASLESQSTEADGWHKESYPVRTSKRYEQGAASAMKSQPGTLGAPIPHLRRPRSRQAMSGLGARTRCAFVTR